MWSGSITLDYIGFLKILTDVPKEREKYTEKNEPSYIRVKCCYGSREFL